jgi:hypothetical protein
MAGGVWALRDWQDWIEEADLGPIAFQFGTRPLLTQQSPISEQRKQRLLTLKSGDVLLHRFSPTGFYSSAVKNAFLKDLEDRSERQVAYAREPEGDKSEAIAIGARGRNIFVAPADKLKVEGWLAAGFVQGMRTPDNTMIFVTEEQSRRIMTDQKDCMGCLSACSFSNWSQHSADLSTGKPADPRSFCIQKTLQNIGHGMDVENELMFAGHNAYKFANDPFYANGHVPTVKELIDRIMTGD